MPAELSETIDADHLGAELGAEEAAPPAAGVGQSARRRQAGLVGQYALLVVLAAFVLAPIGFALIQALSQPFNYARAGSPLHPVDVTWVDRTWFTGGPVSVVGRTLAVVVALAWVQLRAAGAGLLHPGPLAAPRRALSVVAGTVALALLSGPVFQSLYDKSGNSGLLWVVAAAVVAATQLPGLLDPRRPSWLSGLLAGLAGLAVVSVAIVGAGADTWTRGWDLGDLSSSLPRSFAMTLLITVCQVATSVLAAYAFAFLRFPFKPLIFAAFMGTLLLPLEVTLLANVQTIRDQGWINSYQALVLPFAATAFGTFLIRQGFKGIPGELQDATRLDGYGHFAFLWRFAVPLTRPVVASFVVISALQAWNQYLWPQAVIDDSSRQTAQISLRSIVGGEVANANAGVAAALIVALPVAALLVAFQRQIIRGLTAGAVKG
jgi:sn-glycerol 3-phosphate transport system permease protein